MRQQTVTEIGAWGELVEFANRTVRLDQVTSGVSRPHQSAQKMERLRQGATNVDQRHLEVGVEGVGEQWPEQMVSRVVRGGVVAKLVKGRLSELFALQESFRELCKLW